ncbi:Ca2+ transporting ATPase,sarcoplasmic/endoplasmic reticulum [Wickerhamomyces ciferrii]|uniref:Calcium-transporting ATPase n=1 Tax=Wickerhamomyces ciferrii (strain ATCC 14091 / BCRC 22168 / CBS 111 / JCM 3599 / NBRC 0793 / NRRL Y-1031 F-60-10) TaxID=1206466 RepID=K0KQ68_WICCF|nr:Ca2+ transporting ATPase,sarcoplasmic/endoplasmic reticulum [Wickerhamomyces ciferrii]CCH45191.1 Ca2+ transporting ATPase,sarcoplasmic/endoplasmic reticulum [Wickerhamomyces ciferrii]
MSAPYNLSSSQVLDDLDVDFQKGLSSLVAEERFVKFGPNALPKENGTPIWKLILGQFEDQLTLILLGSAVVSFGLAVSEGDLTWTSLIDPIVILTILILNAIVGVQQESSAEAAITALNEYSSSDVKVLRNGKLIHVKQEFLVPGDIIDLSIGDIVPADARIVKIFSQTLRVDQSILTGESESVLKDTEPIQIENAVKQEQLNVVFSGTTIVSGHARAVVILTGEKTAIGDIYTDISSQISQPTPLKEKLDDFGDLLAKFITVICIAVWVINVNNFNDPAHGGYIKGAIYYFKIAVALAVAAIPEGLSVVITTCLALGTKKMAKQNAIVRSLSSVETLGSTNVICSDKTGTLTTNQMVVHNFVFFKNQNELSNLTISGHSFEPQGTVVDEDGNLIELPDSKYPLLHKVSQVSAICNDANVIQIDQTNYKNVGEPTEAALKILVEKLAGSATQSIGSNVITPVSDLYNKQYPRLATYEFTRDRKSMSVLVQTGDNKAELLVKGAPENIISRSTNYLNQSNGSLRVDRLTNEYRIELLRTVEQFASEGYRIIALAYSEDFDKNLAKSATSSQDYEQLESNLTLIGFAALIDPPRPEVAQSIKECKDAGIRVVVITGDSPITAENIAKQIGIFKEDEDTKGLILTGREFINLSDEAKLEASQKIKLFARVEPSHKSLLVDYLQKSGKIVAMTGDGVNDAPALKKADIGISMGSGTDVARLASDLVLQDDNFATIVNAVKEGRLIYNNTRQFIRYLISSNIGEVVSIFLTAALGLPEALIPVQLLWVNLVTDGLPASALGFNPPDLKIMSKPPKSKDEPLVSQWLLFRYIIVGTYVGIATVFGYVWYFIFYEQGPQISYNQLSQFHQCSTKFPEIGCEIFTNEHATRGSTISLSILVIIEMLNAMNNLSESDSLLTFPLWKNVYLILAIILSIILHFAILYIPWLAVLFNVVPLNKDEWIAILVFSSPVIILDELFKLYERLFLIPQVDNEKAIKKNK